MKTVLFFNYLQLETCVVLLKNVESSKISEAFLLWAGMLAHLICVNCLSVKAKRSALFLI